MKIPLFPPLTKGDEGGFFYDEGSQEMKVTHREFLLALTTAQRDKRRFKNLKFERWLWESFAFDNEGAHYIPAEQRKWPNNWPQVNL
jgi:hypothetical protein